MSLQQLKELTEERESILEEQQQLAELDRPSDQQLLNLDRKLRLVNRKLEVHQAKLVTQAEARKKLMKEQKAREVRRSRYVHNVLHSEEKAKELLDLKSQLLETLGRTMALNSMRLGAKTTSMDHSKYLLSIFGLHNPVDNMNMVKRHIIRAESDLIQELKDSYQE